LFQALLKYFSGKDGSAPLEEEEEKEEEILFC